MESRHFKDGQTRMCKRIRGMLLVGSAAVLNFAMIGTSPAAIVPIINAGFEEPVLTLGEFTNGTAVPGWTPPGSISVGVWYPTTAEYPSGAPEGNQVAWSASRTLMQELPLNLVANELYTLTVEVGNRLDSNHISSYEVQLLAGGTVLGSVDETTVFPDPGTFETATVSFTADPTNPNIGQSLEIWLLSDGSLFDRSQVSFDSVTLVTGAVPIPASVWLFGSGMMGLVGIARRKII